MSGAVEVVTLETQRNRKIIGPVEALAVRERRFRFQDCSRYDECLQLAASGGVDFWTCRGCVESRGKWFAFCRRDNLEKRGDGARPPSRPERKTCGVHGVELVLRRLDGSTAKKPTCPACAKEFSERTSRRHAETRAASPMCGKCGDKPVKIRGMCTTCYQSEYNYRRRRGYGFTDDGTCAVCGAEDHHAHGLCARCYAATNRKAKRDATEARRDGARSYWTEDRRRAKSEIMREMNINRHAARRADRDVE